MGSGAQVPEEPAIREVRAAEARRCSAIGQRDREALNDVLSDDLTYLHSTGLLERKDDYIMTSIAGTPRSVERGEIDVRLFGDVAVVTGDYEVRVEPDAESPEGTVVEATGLQVWVRREGKWRLTAHQGTPKPRTASD